jgi:adenylate cyclase
MHDPISSLPVSFRRLFSRLRKRSNGDMVLGEVLIKSGMITDHQLEAALKAQKEKLMEMGKAVPLGLILVELGYASENDLIKVVNAHYNLSVSSLSDNIRELVGKVRGTFIERLPAPKIPIWFQLSISTIFVVALTALVFNFVFLKRQKENLYQQIVKIGLVSLNYFDSNAKIPLIEDNILQLNTLVKNAGQVEGIRYALITDNDKRIKAHTDLQKIGRPMDTFHEVRKKADKGTDHFFIHTLNDGSQILNLTRPIVFNEKPLGFVHVGVSIDFIEEMIRKEKESVILITLLIILLGVIIAVMMGFRYSIPLSKLMLATREISSGNYHHKVILKRNDELGNLAAAFNEMNDKLWKNSLMQESFGKYVGTEILEMIMANPQSTWLKGHRNEATVLFADIRGFTPYSESKEPEQVVAMLNTYFEIATNAILEYGGYVDKFVGDAVLGVFGVPVYRKNHVERAAKAALQLQRKLQEESKRGNKLYAAVGVGIDTGIIVSGNIGSQVKMEYTVIGNCVNTASRLSGLAKPGEIIISKNVCSAIGDIVTFEKLPLQKIKGKTQPVEVFKVLDIHEKPNADM